MPECAQARQEAFGGGFKVQRQSKYVISNDCGADIETLLKDVDEIYFGIDEQKMLI